jgi:hypothetical protein
MSTSIVEQLHSDFISLSGSVSAAVEPSLVVTANDVFRKSLLLAAASEFEVAVTTAIIEFAECEAGASSPLVSFVRGKGLARQYHTLFKWDGSNANHFFALFGEAFKRHADAAVKADATLKDAIAMFLQLGEDRNRLVHQGFGTFVLEKTTEEIFEAYKLAALFVRRIPELLATCPR